MMPDILICPINENIIGLFRCNCISVIVDQNVHFPDQNMILYFFRRRAKLFVIKSFILLIILGNITLGVIYSYDKDIKKKIAIIINCYFCTEKYIFESLLIHNNGHFKLPCKILNEERLTVMYNFFT